MKTTGQDANPRPESECATCGAELDKDEYELCGRCAEQLEADYNERRSVERSKDGQDQW
jgi:predicted amidophosphoribosyltransferase